MYCVVSFRSRNDAYAFFNILQSQKIGSKIIDTPKEIMSSCSLSLQFDFAQIDRVRLIESRVKFASFVGFFKVTEIGTKRIVQQIF